MPVNPASFAPSRFNMELQSHYSPNDEESCCTESYLSSRAAFCIFNNCFVAPLTTVLGAAVPVAASAIGNAIMAKAYHEGYDVLDGVKGSALGSACIIGGWVAITSCWGNLIALHPQSSVNVECNCNFCGPSEPDPEPETTIKLALAGIPTTALNIACAAAGNAILKSVHSSNLSNKNAVIASSVGSGVLIGGLLFSRAVKKLLCG